MPIRVGKWQQLDRAPRIEPPRRRDLNCRRALRRRGRRKTSEWRCQFKYMHLDTIYAHTDLHTYIYIHTHTPKLICTYLPDLYMLRTIHMHMYPSYFFGRRFRNDGIL